MSPLVRRPSLAALVVVALACALAGGCSAVDDFTAFHFADGGADGATAGGDLAGSTVGDPCSVGGCTGGLGCFTSAGNTSFPGGVCSRACDPAGPSCPTGSSCVQVDGTFLCLPACDLAAGAGCRAEWSCCDGQRVVIGPGVCGPTNSAFCGH
ncbi:MAG TPA: hypothetical protein VF997_07390 [Polyangia bacterium]